MPNPSTFSTLSDPMLLFLKIEKEEACIKRFEIKEEKKTERFKYLMSTANKKAKLEEWIFELAAASEETKR